MQMYLQSRQQAQQIIELILQWEGQFNSQRLMNLFNQTRQSISKLINEYKAQYPENIRYNNSQKVYQASPEFQPKLGPCSLESYFSVTHKTALNDAQNSTFCYISSGQSTPKPQIVRPILQAIHQQQRIDIRYISISSPDFEERIISPHSLIYDGHRWHTRAWCEKNQGFRDFVLTRIRNVYDKEGGAKQTRKDDKHWHTKLSFYIEPEPRLSEQQKTIIALDYGMKKKKDGRYQRQYKVRAALLIYWLQQLRIDSQRENPEAQQVVMSEESREELKGWLP